MQDGLAFGRPQIDADAFLVSIQMLPKVVDFTGLCPGTQSVAHNARHVSPAGRFHMNDLRPPTPHEHAGERHGGSTADLNDLNPFQSFWHIYTSTI